jgi:sulfite reductase alpha subunit-like flavoprotein
MMGFMQERDALLKGAKKGGAAVGPALLFFGCRSADEDYIYRDRLEGYLRSGVLTGLHVAFSRDGPSKVYVQVRGGGGRVSRAAILRQRPAWPGQPRPDPCLAPTQPARLLALPPLPAPQDLIQQEGAKVWELLEAGGVVYICGDARRMAPDVKKAFTSVARDCGGRSEASAQNWMGALMEAGRYLEDVWAG